MILHASQVPGHCETRATEGAGELDESRLQIVVLRLVTISNIKNPYTIKLETLERGDF